MLAESGRQIRMPVDHGVHGIAQAVLVERAAQRDIQLHRINIVAVTLPGADVEEQPVLHGGQREHVGDLMLPRQLVDLPLAEPGRDDIRGVNPPPPRLTWAQMPARASNHNRLSRPTCA